MSDQTKPAETVILGRTEFLQLSTAKPKVKPVDLPGHGRCFIRVLRGKELDSFEQGNYVIDRETGEVKYQAQNARARFLVRCLCDKDGGRIFDKDEYADELGNVDGTILDQLYGEAKALNKRTTAAEKEIEKNSGSQAPNAGPGSDSPATSSTPA